MSEFENTPVVIFSQKTTKRNHRSLSQKFAREQDREKSLNSARLCLENIMKFYQAFSEDYKNNNLYGLFNTSEGFYNNAIEFVSLSQHLYKHKLIKLKEIDSNIIIENMNVLIAMIDQLNTERIEWIAESNILDEPQFVNAVQEGSNRIELLKNKIHVFLNNISERVGKEKLSTNQKNH